MCAPTGRTCVDHEVEFLWV